MRRLLHLLIVSSMISGLLLFGAMSAFAQTDLLEGVVPEDLLEDNPTGGLLEQGGLNELLCNLLGGDLLGLELLQCEQPGTVTPPTTPPPAAPVTPVASTGDVGGGHQVSSVPSGGVATGGETAPVGATALIGALLAMAAIGTGLGRALTRS